MSVFRLNYISDLHVDWYRSDAGLGYASPEPGLLARTCPDKHDVILVAGDVSNDPGETADWLLKLGAHWDQVLFVDGNHDFYNYDGTVEDGMQHLRDLLENSNVFYLGVVPWHDKNSNVTVAGANGWHDFAFCPHIHAEWEAKAKYYATPCGDRRNLAFEGSVDTMAVWQASLLRAQIREWAGRRSVVVATHTPPHWHSLDLSDAKLARMPLSPGSLGSSYMTDVLESEASSIRAWVHGHEHGSVTYRHCGVPVFSNARGFPADGAEACRVATLELEY